MTSTLDDLRSALDRHADDLTDTHLPARRTDVAARITRARSRRRATLAGGVAAAVLAVAGVVAGITLPDRDNVQVLAGQALPETVSVYGFGYRLDTAEQSRPGQKTFRLEIPKSDRGRVVSLAGERLGSGTATLTSADQHLDRLMGGRSLTDPVPVGADEQTLTVTLRGAPHDAVVGLALYDRTDQMPAGVSRDGLVFRRTVAADRLLGATIGAPGQRRVSVTVTGPVPAYDVQGLCTSTTKGASLRVSIDGDGGMWTDCTRPDPSDEDAGAAHALGTPAHGLTAGRHVITMGVYDGVGQDAKPIAPDDVRLALGVYRLGPTTTLSGLDMADEYEDAGRTWKLEKAVPYRPGLQVDATDAPAEVGAVFGAGTLHMRAQGADGERLDWGQQTNRVDGAMGTWGYLLLPGTTYTLHWDAQPRSGDHAKRWLLVYRPVG